MSEVVGGAASFLILLALLALRVPIGVAMLAVGCGGFAWIQGWGPLFSFLKTAPFDTFATYSFSVIPLFLLMGNVASTPRLSTRRPPGHPGAPINPARRLCHPDRAEYRQALPGGLHPGRNRRDRIPSRHPRLPAFRSSGRQPTPACSRCSRPGRCWRSS